MIFYGILFISLLLFSLVSIIAANNYRKKWNGEIYEAGLLPKSTFSIIIPYRNERKNLNQLLESLQILDYPEELFEVIWIDDHSADSGDLILGNYISQYKPSGNWIHLINEKTGKKNAVDMGVRNAKMDFILTIDADCNINREILNDLNWRTQLPGKFIFPGPVIFKRKEGNISEAYQRLENSGLIVYTAFGISIGKPFMANGANLCYSRKAFLEVSGFEGSNQHPGGDDEFILEKIMDRYPDSALFRYSENSLVLTQTQSGFHNLIQQRIRWAGKGKYRRGFGILAVQFFVFVMYSSLLISPLTGLIYQNIWLAVLPILLKSIHDMWFYTIIKNPFQLDLRYEKVFLSTCIQCFFVPYIAIRTLNGKFSWKERNYSV
ncbi:MAG: glycosyltransferase [Bacteroidetes bacterium]|nr:glycosyltransferase [Bacteroidota bacterium]